MGYEKSRAKVRLFSLSLPAVGAVRKKRGPAFAAVTGCLAKA